jgi:hypothetical protein
MIASMKAAMIASPALPNRKMDESQVKDLVNGIHSHR